MKSPDPGRTGAGNRLGKLLGGSDPLLASAFRKINSQSTAAIEKPRSPYPIFWRPNHSGPHLALVGAGGA